MKIILLAIVVLIVCFVLFVVGVFSPGRSRRMHGEVDRLASKGEREGDERAGKLGDMTRDALEKSRQAADASAAKGREVHDKVAGGS